MYSLLWENVGSLQVKSCLKMKKKQNLFVQHDILMICLQLLSSCLAVLDISSTRASPWNTLARLTYRKLCLFFSQFWLAPTIDSLARGLRIQSKRPLPCLLYCTSLSTAQHGWPSYAVAFSLRENAAVLW